MAHFVLRHGEKSKIFTFTIKHESFIFTKLPSYFVKNFKILNFLTMSKVKIGHILPTPKNATTILFQYSIVSDKLPEN